ncbi:MAG: glycosyltransferase [Nocardioidaceae bacterium]
MHVLHVSEVSWGGVVSLLRDFTSEQVRRGHRVSVLAPVELPDLDTAVRRTDWLIDRRRPSTFPRAMAQLRATIRRERPDVVHLHSAFAGFLGRLPLVGTGCTPVVYQPHAWSFDVFEDARLRWMSQRWEQLADRRTDVLVGNCEDEISQGRRLGMVSPGHSLGVPLDLEHFHLVDADERARHREALQMGGQRSLLCLARLAKQKGQDLLVSAWEAAPIPETVLWLVGPGDPEPLRALAPTQWGRTISWVGDQADVRPYIWTADLLVLPSRYETVAVVVTEAMACGTPVVAVAVNGAAMAISDGPQAPGGVVVAPGDMSALLAESERLLDDPATRETLGRAGRHRVSSLFARPLVVDRLDEAYASAMRGQR